jgi:type VI secretion system protein ImpA
MPKADVQAAFKDTPAEELLAYYTAAKAAFENVNAIDAVFLERTPGFGPSLDPLQKMLGAVVNILAKETGADAPPAENATEAAEVPAGAAASGAPAAGNAVSAPGQIASAGDVAKALDSIIAYYERNEPSSPLPILLARARRLIGANFMTIMNDMAPLGVENVNLVGGIEEDYSE